MKPCANSKHDGKMVYFGACNDGLLRCVTSERGKRCPDADDEKAFVELEA